MNTLATTPLATCAVPTPLTARRGFRWRWFFLTLGGLASVAAIFLVALLLSFRMGGEARTIRHAVFAATPGAWSPEFEFGVGRLPAFLARAGFRLADASLDLDLPPEAGAGIAAFRSADIGIYRRLSSSPAISHATTLAEVDGAMSKRDWEPIVSVLENDQCVLIFVPKNLADLHDTRACVFVMEQEQLVIVSARLDLEPLVSIATSKLHHSP